MQIKYVKMHFVRQQPDVVYKKREEFKHKNLTAAFLKYLDSQNCFEGKKDIFTDEVIASGKLPSGYSIHHILPLYGGGDNKLDNLQIVDDKLHKFLHTCFFIGKNKKFIYGKSVRIKVPALKPVASLDDYTEFVKKHMAWHMREDLEKIKRKRRHWDKIVKEEISRNAEDRIYKKIKPKVFMSDEIAEEINNLMALADIEAV